MKLIKSILWNRNLILKNKVYLKPGIYVLHPCLRAYTRIKFSKKDSVNLPITKLKGIKQVVMSLIRHFFVIIVWRNNSIFSGEAVYLSNTPILENRDLKIFNLEDKKVLIKSANEDSFRENIRLNTLVSNVFSPLVPQFSIFDADQYLYTIDYISNYSRSIITKDILLRLFTFYKDYYNNGDRRISTINEGDVPNDFEFCVNYIGCQCVEYLHHGDLSRDNMILTNEGELYLIDFEHLSYYPPFYDIFYFLVNTEVCVSDNQVRFEEILREHSMLLNFNGKNMLYYFEMYVIYFYKNHMTVWSSCPAYRNVFKRLHSLISEIINKDAVPNITRN